MSWSFIFSISSKKTKEKHSKRLFGKWIQFFKNMLIRSWNLWLNFWRVNLNFYFFGKKGILYDIFMLIFELHFCPYDRPPKDEKMQSAFCKKHCLYRHCVIIPWKYRKNLIFAEFYGKSCLIFFFKNHLGTNYGFWFFFSILDRQFCQKYLVFEF